MLHISILIITLLFTPFINQSDISIEENRYFRFYFLPENSYGVKLLMDSSEEHFKQISSDLDFQPEFPQKISVYILPESTNIKIAGKNFPSMPHWVAGFADTERGIIVLRSASIKVGSSKNIIIIFKHELSHIIIRAYLGENYTKLPWWFSEGQAMWHAKEWTIHDSIYLSESLIRGSFLPLREMSGPLAKSEKDVKQMYAEALSFFLYLHKRFGPDITKEILTRVRYGEGFDEAFQQLTQQRLEQLEANWKRGLNFKYKWIPIISSSTTLWIAISLLFIISYIRKKRKTREILKKWEEEDFFC